MSTQNGTSLVTGGAGFIGSELVRQLLDQGENVIVYDNFSFGRRSNLPKAENLRVVIGDLTDIGKFRGVLKKWEPRAVFHLAALHFIPYCNAHPQETLRVNVEGTECVLQACKESTVKVLVYASTAAVYGVRKAPHRESEQPAPVDIYGLSKLFGEWLVRKFHAETGIRCRIARLFNGYGRRETSPHVIPEILKQVCRGDIIRLGNIKPKRDFVHTSDIARAFRLMAEADGFDLDVFNVGTGKSVSVEAFVQAIASILDRPLQIVVDSSRVRKVERLNLAGNRSKIRSVLGWEPKVTAREGMIDLLDEAGLLRST